MLKAMHGIYPKELVLVPDLFDASSAPFLDLRVNIDKHFLSTSIFENRGAFNFPIVKFSTFTVNIPKKKKARMVCLHVKWFVMLVLAHTLPILKKKRMFSSKN